MEKNKGFEWIKDKFEYGKDEVVKLTRISKLRIEISSLNKKKEERLLTIGKRVVQLIEEGKISEDYFEPDYSGTVQFDEKIEALIAEIEELKLVDEDVEDVSLDDELTIDKIEESDVEVNESATVLEAETVAEEISEEEPEGVDADDDVGKDDEIEETNPNTDLENNAEKEDKV